MGYITNIRTYFGKRSLKKELLKATRIKRPVNLDKARTIGILYQLSSEAEYHLVSKFTKKLQDQGKRVQVIGMFSYNRMPMYYIPKLAYDLLLPKDTDLFMRPDTEFALKFMEEPFDILIDLSTPDTFPLHYISSLSKASFKVGRMAKDQILPYDLMIDAGTSIESEELINQIIYYSNAFELIANNQNPTSEDGDQ